MLTNIILYCVNGEIDSTYATLKDLCVIKKLPYQALLNKKFPIKLFGKKDDFYIIKKFPINRKKEHTVCLKRKSILKRKNI